MAKRQGISSLRAIACCVLPILLPSASAFRSAVYSSRSVESCRLSRSNRLIGQAVDREVRSAASVKTITATHAHSNSQDMSKKGETVAIIGGGIAGLSCAQALTESGKFVPTVFDTGRLRPGGRCSSRQPNDRPKKKDDASVKGLEHISKVTVDHTAQILSIPDGFSEFAEQVKAWEEAGTVKRFPSNSVYNILNPYDRKTKTYDKKKVRYQALKGNFYHGTSGMGAIPCTMAKRGAFDVQQDVWVSPSNGVRYVAPSNGHSNGHWQVFGNNGREEFDHLVIAHNGKCADRLMSKTPAKDLHKLLRVKFAPYVPKDGGRQMTLNSIYSVCFALPKNSALSKAVPNDFVSGFVRNSPNLKFLSSNTRKYDSEGSGDDVEVWTVLSSAKFGKANKGPQEFLPADLQQNVTEKLLASLEQSLVLPEASLADAILERRVQLWGAAVPVNAWKAEDETADGFLYDNQHGVGACGDWLLDPSIGGAWESGRRLAKHMSKEAPTTAGLQGNFQASTAVDKAGIGSIQ